MLIVIRPAVTAGSRRARPDERSPDGQARPSGARSPREAASSRRAASRSTRRSSTATRTGRHATHRHRRRRTSRFVRLVASRRRVLHRGRRSKRACSRSSARSFAENLLATHDPIGQTFALNDRSRFASSACSTSKGASPFGQDQDDVVICPLATAQTWSVGNTGRTEYCSRCRRRTGAIVAQSEIAALLRDRHRIQSRANRDFSVQHIRNSQISKASRSLTLLAPSIASHRPVCWGHRHHEHHARVRDRTDT